ncbi:MAG: MFS transporter [Simkania sp.]|nr:MFS transporter [Simkania sp.]
MTVLRDIAKRETFLTRVALFGSSIFSEPLTVLLCLLPFILAKDLEASAWQISLLISLRPIMSLVSFYWSALLGRKSELLKLNLIASGILARLPFIFVFAFEQASYLIFAAAVYILFSRAGIPAWMEMLKRNLPKEPRGKLFSLAYMIGYAEGIGIGFAMGFLLDLNSEYWKYLFLISSLLGLLGVFLQYRVPLPPLEKTTVEEHSLSLWQTVVQPWKDGFTLMRTRPDFARFQWGFMWGGAGVMLVTAVLPLFFVHVLKLSHTNFSTARAVCMGIGVVLTSSIWGKALGKTRLIFLTSIVILLFALFPACLLLAPYHITWFYVAYLIWGIAQGGSHIIWNLSGPMFAGSADSSPYSSVNVLMVGLRGMVFPFLGSLLASYYGPTIVLILGLVSCLLGAFFMRAYSESQDQKTLA